MSPRDPQRMTPLLDALRTLWEMHPDMRLGQLLVNLGHAADTKADLFNIEDDVMLETIKHVTEEKLFPPRS